MKATDVFQWIVIGGAIFMVFLLFLWSLCSMAKLSDKRSEKYWESQLKEHEDNTEQELVETLAEADDT